MLGVDGPAETSEREGVGDPLLSRELESPALWCCGTGTGAVGRFEGLSFAVVLDLFLYPTTSSSGLIKMDDRLIRFYCKKAVIVQ
jgi:hypothetical protein